jgi:peptide methionine sulfoxide reductase MsrB
MMRWPIILFVLIVIAILGGVFLTQVQLRAAPQQPVAYSHRIHVEAGVQCLDCHSSALSTDLAGIPSVQKCMGCHTVIATDDEAVQALTGYWERNEPIPWERVNQQLDFVYFSHQAHLRSGVNCETCHGDIGQMTVTRPVVKMDMGWCLNCHLDQPEEKVARLADCLACHK